MFLFWILASNKKNERMLKFNAGTVKREALRNSLTGNLIQEGWGGGGRNYKRVFMLKKPKKDTESLEKFGLRRLCFQRQN